MINYNFKRVESIQEKVKQTIKDSELSIKVLPVVIELIEKKYLDKKITIRFFTEVKKILKERNIIIEFRGYHYSKSQLGFFLSDVNRQEYRETKHYFYLGYEQINFDTSLLTMIKTHLTWAYADAKNYPTYTREVIEQTQARLKELEIDYNKKYDQIADIMPVHLLTS